MGHSGGGVGIAYAIKHAKRWVVRVGVVEGEVESRCWREYALRGNCQGLTPAMSMLEDFWVVRRGRWSIRRLQTEIGTWCFTQVQAPEG
jgi:hypothetical protein